MSTAPPAPSPLWSRRSPDGPWDTIVVGSGMGGMACAALLSTFGQRVLILEQHHVPGGMTHVFRRKGWTWDVGVHAIGEVTADAKVGRLLDRLCGGRIVWASLGPVYDEFHYPGGTSVSFPDDPRRFVETLVELFPDERLAIERYARLIQQVGDALRNYFLSYVFGPSAVPTGERGEGRNAEHWIAQRTYDVLRSLTSNERLITVLSAQWGYYGAEPRESSFAIHALVAKHFWNGGYYPRGGSASIATGLLRTVADAGGAVRVAASVAELLFDGDRAVGVRLDDGEELRAERVVSAIGGINTVERLLPEALQREDWARGVAALEPSPAHLCLYLGFEGDIRAAGASAANQWFYETWSTRPDQWHLDAIPERVPILYTSFPSLKDPDHDPGPRQRHTGEVVTFVPHDDFTRWFDTPWRKRGADYDALKQELSDRILRQLLSKMPALEPMVRYTELSTPLSTTYFTRATRGAIYGIKPTPERFQAIGLRPDMPVPGLFMSGSDVATVGVMGAFLGGVLTAAAIDPLRAMRFLRSID